MYGKYVSKEQCYQAILSTLKDMKIVEDNKLDSTNNLSSIIQSLSSSLRKKLQRNIPMHFDDITFI